MLKKFIILLLIIILLFSNNSNADTHKFRYEFFDTFDTLISIIAFAENKEIFDEEMQNVYNIFLEYHKLFDIYNEYEGINNIYTINKIASKEPVKVSDKLFEFLLYAKTLQERISSTANIAFGRVLNIWHDARMYATKNPDKSYLPDISNLEKAATHCDIKNMVLDEINKTVFFTDKILLDVGSIAKGYACEKAAQYLLKSRIPHFIINAGGNIRTGLAPQDGRVYWGIGIADPFKVNTGQEDVFDIVFAKESSIVTSGDYQRFFTHQGKRYHHIIDPITLFPANYFRSVSIYTENSALADYLSTTLYCLPVEKGKALVESLNNVEAMWILNDATQVSTDGFRLIQKSQGASSFTPRN